jgi:hypothetical protein
MFETEGFKEELAKAVSSEAGQSGLAQYETRIVEYLQSLASANESVLMESEMKKAVGRRRGVPDALISARELVREASRRTQAEKREILQLSDVQEAYKKKFCQIWPFCKE